MAGQIVIHSFYCMNCGKMAMELPRKKGFQYERFHRKKLYCPYCKTEINCVECKNDDDVFEFRENFLNGAYEDEKEKSLDFIGQSREWEEHLY